MSDLDVIIPAEISGDIFYDLIEALAAKEELSNVLEIGSSAGDGSTQAFVSGLKRNKYKSSFCERVFGKIIMASQDKELQAGVWYYCGEIAESISQTLKAFTQCLVLHPVHKKARECYLLRKQRFFSPEYDSGVHI